MLMSGIALVRFFSMIPDLFFYVENSVFVKIEGLTHYRMAFESSLPYSMIELIFIGYSLLLMSFLITWARARVLYLLWLIKASVAVSIAIFGV